MAYRTLHHTRTETRPKIRKVTVPRPPALPSFDLVADDYLDETDIAVTSERHAARPVDDRIIPKRSPDSTSEVAPEDILLEAFTDAPLRVERPKQVPVQSMLPPPPTRQQLADLDQLLKLSVRPVAQMPMEQETPSVAPVALSNASFASIQGYASELGPSFHTDPRSGDKPQRSGVAGLFMAAALLVVGGVVGLVIVKAPLPMLQQAIHGGKAHVLSTGAWPPVRYAEPKEAAKPTTPEVSVSSLPKQEIPANMTVMSLPPRAVGHRVWVDGVVVGTGSSPVTVKCGRHNVKIGGKVSRVNLPCGEAYSFK